jgi:hypothetical protein
VVLRPAPLLGFAGHAVAEPANAGAEVVPVLLIGLLIQISFALTAVALARRVLSLVEALAHALPTPALRHAPRPSTTVRRLRTSLAPVFMLGFVHTGRGPPLLTA